MSLFQTISPVDNTVLFERSYATEEQINSVLDKSQEAQKSWKRLDLQDRIAHLNRFVDAVGAQKELLARELTSQMGRPIRYTQGEINGFEQRARKMLELAPQTLANVIPPQQPQFTRYIKRSPLGVVLVLSPWNYPYLTAVNVLIPALAAGNTVVLKHSEQTALCAERLAECAEQSGMPPDIFQVIHCTHQQVAQIVDDSRVNFVAFTGSVAGGQAVQNAAAQRFLGIGLELGGKDPAYVRGDANLAYAVENLVDGAFFNSGQSCCGIERIYVHQSLYKEFVDEFVKSVKTYKLGNPFDEETTLGPMVRTSNAERVRSQIKEAVQAGAKALIDSDLFVHNKDNTPYLAPQVLINVNHQMTIMREESFGPVVGIMSVSSDSEAVELMNDSEFGLTASIWTNNEEAAQDIGEQLETGTVFMNRCDYLDPELAWVGVKNSGRGCTLSQIGFEQLTRPKSFHLKSIT